MNRYSNRESNVYRRHDGRQVLYTTRYPKIPTSLNDVYVIANETDSLDALAYKFYKDSSFWWMIAQANGIGLGLKPKAGQQLRIPMNVTEILNNFTRENS
jgi:nucleoid-associated protein YgaU